MPLTFKIFTPAGNACRRVTYNNVPTIDDINSVVETLTDAPSERRGLVYVDSDGDRVVINSACDVHEVVKDAQAAGAGNIIKLHVCTRGGGCHRTINSSSAASNGSTTTASKDHANKPGNASPRERACRGQHNRRGQWGRRCGRGFEFHLPWTRILGSEWKEMDEVVTALFNPFLVQCPSRADTTADKRGDTHHEATKRGDTHHEATAATSPADNANATIPGTAGNIAGAADAATRGDTGEHNDDATTATANPVDRGQPVEISSVVSTTNQEAVTTSSTTPPSASAAPTPPATTTEANDNDEGEEDEFVKVSASGNVTPTANSETAGTPRDATDSQDTAPAPSSVENDSDDELTTKAALLQEMGFDIPTDVARTMIAEMGGRIDLIVRALVANNK